MVVVTAAAGGGHKLLLISGKQSGGSSSANFGRPISVVLPSASSQASSDSESSSSAGPPVRKRQRLTHLSPEEKALRRKLKNRVAAQTARDRKKAKMGELEQQVLELELENQKLHIENRLLREKTSGLLSENEELKQRLGLHTLESKEKSDLLLGILDILDPELFLKTCEQECQDPRVLLVGGGDPVPAATPAPLGAPPVKLEALNGLIHFDHLYTKPAEVAGEESDHEDGMASFPVAEVVVEEDERVCVKDEPEEVVIPGRMDDDFLCAASSPALGGLDKEACLADTYSDSGYEGSPSPFSDMSSPLCSESPWDDMFANELFPQLISV